MPHVQDSLGVPGHRFLVGDDADGRAAAVHVAQQRHDLFTGLAVNVTGRLVDKDQERVVDCHPNQVR